MTAYETLDAQAAKGYFCEWHAERMDEAWERSFVQLEASGIDTTELLGTFAFNTGALK
jgi:hypothetical protein